MCALKLLLQLKRKQQVLQKLLGATSLGGDKLANLHDLLHSDRCFSVKFAGEAGSDAGGLYRETLDRSDGLQWPPHGLPMACP